jgi:hypothetical protein
LENLKDLILEDKLAGVSYRQFLLGSLFNRVEKDVIINYPKAI